MYFGSMTLREKVLQTFVVTIREINKHGGLEHFFKQYPVGGMYYNEKKDYVSDNEPETGTAAYHKRISQCRMASKYPLLVCADGALFPNQKVNAGYRSVAGSRSEKDAYNYGRIIGMQMNINDIDWVLGPRIDMNYDRTMPFLAMPDDPEITSRLCRSIVRGIQDMGVCATVKHFPGLGTTNINMHFAPGQNSLKFNEWMESYGYTYKEMIDEGVMSVMTTHVTLRSYDNEYSNGFCPIATYSEKLTSGLLKKELGFEGAVVTDALIMGGNATGDPVGETVQAFKAGADLLLWPPVEAAERIADLIECGEIPMSRLEDALSRIERLREFRKNAKSGKIQEPDKEFAESESESIIRHGICLVRNELGLIPLRKICGKVLIIDATDSGKASELLRDELELRGFVADVKRMIYDVESRVCWQDDIDNLQTGYETVIINVDTAFLCSWSVPFMLIWASHMFDKSKKIVINHGSPFFAKDYFPDDPTVIDTNADPTKTSVKAVVDGLLGNISFRGYTTAEDKRENKRGAQKLNV